MGDFLPPLKPELEELDAIILGTDIKEAIQAASLALDGRAVLHLDKEPLYGQRHATRSLREMNQWAGGKEDLPEILKAHGRGWNLDRCPQLLPAAGDVVDLLIASDASSHVEFKLLNSAYILLSDPASSVAEWIPVPSSKEAIFSSTTLSLLEKRKLMRFLTYMASVDEEGVETEEEAGSFRLWIMKRFGLSARLADIVQYGVLMDGMSSPHTPESLQVQGGKARARSLLQSVGRYGASPFLFPMFGMGDVAQAFCRMAAVHGAIYVMQRQTGEVSEGDKDLWLPETKETLSSKRILAHPDYLKNRGSISKTRKYLCIVPAPDPPKTKDNTEEEGEAQDTLEENQETSEDGAPTVFTLPPTSENTPAVYVLSVGYAVQASPKGWLVLYVSFTSIDDGSDQKDQSIFEHSFREEAALTLSWLEEDIPGEDGSSPVLWSLPKEPLEQIRDLLHRPAFSGAKEEEDDAEMNGENKSSSKE
ncbi:GDP dissociation inhibitor-domain-containing protein [Piptocephalis cylindrospora]|uniref:GDP dissociation inhibitor-domain-containing protein n=1 Tax=Piptocephalis cylindrospora TaxID=1907219 RepID=A0A4V1IYN7_9FUNG|nr:GDP dissociation inhibitor-domain-containing protein [Piptocephalis cylindrospora]|eukprot:RKP15199.1 GDP dissociation inhibitor-domain-containing protein [Piptocephalis cylindrospora]